MLKEKLIMFSEKQAAKITWLIVIVSIIAIVGLGIFAAMGLNYSFPDLTKILP